MRTIRFRAKRVDNGEWVFGGYSYCEKDNTHYITVMGKDHISHIGFHQQVYPETIGQYTGLKDKKGKEIYEGDILKMRLGCDQMDINEYDVICQVVYGFRGRGSEIGFTGETKAGFQIPLASQCCLQVIGNIYENPELIGEEV